MIIRNNKMLKAYALILAVIVCGFASGIWIWKINRSRVATDIFEAIQTNDLVLLESLVASHNPDDVQIPYRDPQISLLNHHRPLAIASMIGSAESIEILLKAGSCVSCPDDANDSPLILALRAGNASSALVLLDAETGLRTHYEWGFLMFSAGSSGDKDCMDIIAAYLHENNISLADIYLQASQAAASQQPLILAFAQHDKAEAVIYMVQHGSNINAIDTVSGMSPTMYLCKYYRCTAVRRLLSLGANLEHVDKNNKSLKDYIVEYCPSILP